MIKKIHIEQFVLITTLDLDFMSGLTSLTGETGAGKSIILDALGLILGDPTDTGSIRYGCDQSIIEVVFATPQHNDVWKYLTSRDLVEKGQTEFTIRRVTRTDGTEDMSVNGRPVSLDALKEIGAFLCEIHGQNANHKLMDPEYQLTLLDLSGNFPPDAFKNVADALRELNKNKKAEEEEIAFYNGNIQKLSTFSAIVEKLEEAGLHEQSVEEITSEYNRLLTAQEACEALQDINSRLVASNGAIMSLSGAEASLNKQKNLDAEKMKPLKDRLAAALENARAAASEARRLAPEYEIDTKPLWDYKDKVEIIEDIAAENEIEFNHMDAYYDEMRSKVDRLKDGRGRMANFAKQVEKSQINYRNHAQVLTKYRIAAGEELSKAINIGLPLLKLLGAEFRVQVDERPNSPWTERGFNFVTFMARMNAGQAFSSISETASGGELARLVLALKIVIQTIQTIPTLVFDEVDVGIGGAAAAAVGERIAYLADTTQVLIITHSPQVASRGEQQLYVSKKTEDGVTSSRIRVMTYDERVNEISRMLAGDTITGEAQAAAKSLLQEAVDAAKERRSKKPAVAATSPPVESSTSAA